VFDTGPALCIVVFANFDTGPALCIDTSKYIWWGKAKFQFLIINNYQNFLAMMMSSLNKLKQQW